MSFSAPFLHISMCTMSYTTYRWPILEKFFFIATFMIGLCLFQVETRLRQHIRALTGYRSQGLTRLHHIRMYERLKSQRDDTLKKKQAFDQCVKNLQVIFESKYDLNSLFAFVSELEIHGQSNIMV